MENHESVLHAACIVDQKDLNEAVVQAVASVAQTNVHHCAELFDIPVRLAQRFAAMAAQSADRRSEVDPLEDLATTPTALWRVSMTAEDLERMQTVGTPDLPTHLEAYRHVVVSLNTQTILLLLRYAADPRLAALVSGVESRTLMADLSAAGCSTLIQSVHRMNRPLVSLTLNEAYLDRVFCTLSGLPVESHLRALVARTLCSWDEYASISHVLDCEAQKPRHQRATKIGRPTAVFIPPEEAQTIRRLIALGVSTQSILQFTQCDVNSAQVRRLRQAADDELAAKGEPAPLPPEVPKTHDSNAAIWGSAVRRLLVTAIFAHQRALVAMGVSPHAALVEAYEFHITHHRDPLNPLTMSRLISAVHAPMLEGLVHLGHCGDCGTMYLSHDGHHNGIECPVCAMAKFNKLGRSNAYRAASWLPAHSGRPLSVALS